MEAEKKEKRRNKKGMTQIKKTIQYCVRPSFKGQKKKDGRKNCAHQEPKRHNKRSCKKIEWT